MSTRQQTGTREKLVSAAAALLDSGGESAVTLRAVGQAVGVSHNAPYKHFKDRSALLAAVAIEDFGMLAEEAAGIRLSPLEPMAKLRRSLGTFIDYGREHPSRYRLLFGDPGIAARGGELEEAALRAFAEFAAIVGECQSSGDLPEISNVALTGLLYASVHGLIDIEAGGRMRREKGLVGVAEGMDLLIDLLSRGGTKPGSCRGSPGATDPA
jgi:AcrR family transcriptional regulator